MLKQEKHKILTISMLIGAALAILLSFFSSYAEFSKQCRSVKGEVLRLHILAHSDSEEDQQLKYDLRDFLLEQMKDIFISAENLEQAIKIAEANLHLIKETSQEFIYSQGFEYQVEVDITNIYFTTRVYENITMPAGNYAALEIRIGSGEGRNWWCVAFPPLCLPAASNRSRQAAAEAYFTPEVSRVITQNGGRPEVRFALYEWFQGRFK